jgi:hypothetical protein
MVISEYLFFRLAQAASKTGMQIYNILGKR